jgi:hypothetical protein
LRLPPSGTVGAPAAPGRPLIQELD